MTRGKKPAGRRGPPTEDKTRITSSDAALWQHVAESVKPLRRTRPATLKQSPAPPAKPKQRSAAVASSLPAPRAAPPPTRPPASKGFDRATETRFKRGDLDIEGRIDLHGMTQDAAYRALMRFIDRARAAEKRTLLIITGKGRLSEGGGVLRRLVPQWLEAGPHAAHILAVTSAHAKDGGTGAYYVRLRRPRSKND